MIYLGGSSVFLRGKGGPEYEKKNNDGAWATKYVFFLETTWRFPTAS